MPSSILHNDAAAAGKMIFNFNVKRQLTVPTTTIRKNITLKKNMNMIRRNTNTNTMQTIIHIPAIETCSPCGH